MKKLLLLGTLFWFSISANANNANGSLSIDTCYVKARENFPLIKQKELIDKTREYNISNAAKGYLPQLNFAGQATDQSAVTAIPVDIHIPGFNLSIPTVKKEQFNVHGEIDQTIYNGGIIKQQQESSKAAADIQEQSIEVQLYVLKDRINQLFFGTLLIDEQLKQNDLTEKDIQNSIDKMQASVAAGVSLKSGLSELQAKLLQQQQNKIDLQSSRKAYLEMLGLFINATLDEHTTLEAPKEIGLSDKILRPELLLYNSQQNNDDVQAKILDANNRPKVQLFFQGGYALPGLNAFDTDPALYYIGGLKFSWSLGGFYTLKNQKQLLTLDKQTIDIQREIFMFNTNLTLHQQSAEVLKLQQMISKDDEIVSKLTEVKNSAKAQMDNGLLTTHDYISELDAEDQAKQKRLVHHVQLLMDQYNYKNTSGN
jgi:outer membrane protein TolC